MRFTRWRNGGFNRIGLQVQSMGPNTFGQTLISPERSEPIDAFLNLAIVGCAPSMWIGQAGES